jgi:hypothetical protein
MFTLFPDIGLGLGPGGNSLRPVQGLVNVSIRFVETVAERASWHPTEAPLW